MRVSFYTLGCKVNQYETQMMRELFEAAGYEAVDEEEAADICIINTCTVTNLSDRKSRQRIRRVKKKNRDAVVVVTGCYAQTDAEAVAAIPGVSVIAGNNEKSRIVTFVEEYLAEVRRAEQQKDGGERSADWAMEEKQETREIQELQEIQGIQGIHVLPYEALTDYEEGGSITYMDSRTRAYIKIQDGCDRFCSYCIIPYARGRVRSRGVEDIVREAEGLIERGFREIVLTGINTALYGSDLCDEGLQEDGGEPRGVEIAVKAISEIDGDFRIRLSSLEPNVIDEETARRLGKYPKLCPHMHLSLQSGSDSILRRMNRRYDVDAYRRIVEIFRKQDSGFAVTTDIIVGFPGETEEEFSESLRAAQEIGFCKVHVFKYSRRNGTPAAAMEAQIPEEVKSQRAGDMIRLAERVSREFFLGNTGTVRRVLFERYDPARRMLTGLTDNYIHTYCRAEPAEAEKLLNRFGDVLLEELYEDGVRGSIMG